MRGNAIGLPGQHAGAKARRARCGGMLQASAGRALIVPEWASSRICAAAWESGYRSIAAARAAIARAEKQD